MTNPADHAKDTAGVVRRRDLCHSEPVLPVSQAHTAQLTTKQLSTIRALLDHAFDNSFTDEDWDHTLGGVHIFLQDHDEIVAHAAVIQRRLLHQDRSIRTGYIEGLAVHENHRRRGYGTAVMATAERIVTSAHDLGALSDGAGIEGFYERRGWQVWPGPTWVLAPDGPRRTDEDDDGVLVLSTPTSPKLLFSESITCDWRAGDVW